MSLSFSSHQVCVNFEGRPILRSVCCHFAPGWTHIIGPNGAGKSTWIRALAGLIRVDSGEVLLDGVRIDALGVLARAEKIAYVPQRLESVPEVSVLSFVSQGTYAWGIGGAAPEQRLARARHALRALGVFHLASRRLCALSGGELEMCILASAVAQRARILLLDEPTAALDVGYSEVFCRAVRRLTRKGMIVISVTHDLGQASRYADRVIVMSRGRIVSDAAKLPSPRLLGQVYRTDPQVFERYVGGARDHVRRVRCVAVLPRHCVSMRDIPMPMHTRDRGRAAAKALKDCAAQEKHALWIALAVTVCTLLVCPWIGSTSSMTLDVSREVFWQLRVPRVIWGALSGGVLALVGSVLQSLFQNALATPYTLGLASGASLGAMIAIQFSFAGILGLSAASCIGGILTMCAVIGVSSRFGRYQPINCLLAGIAASMFCSAAGLVVQAFATPLTAHQMMRWQLGGLEVTGYGSLLSVPVIAAGLIYLYLSGERLDMMRVDTELAASRGVRVVRTRALVILAAGLATSIVVSMCGPIGFIGLVIPHIVRRIYGCAMRQLMVLCALYGATFLVLADSVSRVLERFAWIPVGVITAAIGAPVLVYMIQKKHPGT